IKEYLKEDEFALYKLIWKRFVASQMEDAIYHNTKAQIECGEAMFLAQGSICTFKGFRSVYETPDDEEDKSLPNLKKGEP
ncbi:MAG: DNA topoisomerase, partial [Acidobacteria bacterium]|nr:DNA topoisomerase [Acidobacteriota bacterium]